MDLLDLIELKLLRMRPEHRATCDEIVNDLQAIYTGCLHSEQYCVTPVSGSEPRRVDADDSELSPRQPEREFEGNARDFDDQRRSDTTSQVLSGAPASKVGTGAFRSIPSGRGNKSVRFASDDNDSEPNTGEANVSPSVEAGSTENEEEVERDGSPKLESAKPTDNPVVGYSQTQNPGADTDPPNIDRILANSGPGIQDSETVRRNGRRWWRVLVSVLCNIQEGEKSHDAAA